MKVAGVLFTDPLQIEPEYATLDELLIAVSILTLFPSWSGEITVKNT